MSEQQQPPQPPQPPPGYPYPYPYPPPGYTYPYTYPPPGQAPPPQQAGGFDWERRLPNMGQFDWERARGQQQQPPPPYGYPPYPGYPPPYGYPPGAAPPPPQPAVPERPLFDWEKKNVLGEKQPPAEDIVIDWSYRSSKNEEPEITVERDIAVSAKCTSRAFDASTLPEVSDQVFKFSAQDAQAEVKAQLRRQTFQKRVQAKQKDTARIKFQFDAPEVMDLEVGATFAILETTNKLFAFLNDEVLEEGAVFKVFTLVPPKQILSTTNQRLKDVKVTGNIILNVKFTKFTGLKAAIAEEFRKQKEAGQ